MTLFLYFRFCCQHIQTLFFVLLFMHILAVQVCKIFSMKKILNLVISISIKFTEIYSQYCCNLFTSFNCEPCIWLFSRYEGQKRHWFNCTWMPLVIDFKLGICCISMASLCLAALHEKLKVCTGLLQCSTSHTTHTGTFSNRKVTPIFFISHFENKWTSLAPWNHKGSSITKWSPIIREITSPKQPVQETTRLTALKDLSNGIAEVSRNNPAKMNNSR